jgi:nitroimidazol reductase NimA-like FMN-containing flavoprotein (pyridoxamine 5'-phosphate oxidase superfamily)
MNTQFVPTKRTRLKRLSKRASYERKIIYQILDEAFICHVGFISDGQPVVIPTAYGRAEDVLYIHGSVASRMLRALADGIRVCVTVTLVDGLVLARSAFHHSMNYRSVVVFGKAYVVRGAMEKAKALRLFSEHVLPGRWAEVRQPNDGELKKTMVLRMPLMEASAKIRSGPPIDEESDYDLRVWAGELPLSLVAGEPITDPRLLPGIQVPAYIETVRVRFARARRR